MPSRNPSFSVYPVPGTLTAGEKTTISFRGGGADAIGTVTVRGSRSGSHPGKLQAHPDGQGASFVPDKPFEANEKVSVTTDRNIVGATSGDFAINIGDETTRKARPVEFPNVGRGTVQKYATRPDLEPPSVTVTTAKPGRAPGLVFLAPKAGRGQDGPMIINDKGQTVWFKSTPGKIPADFRVQQLGGKPVLTWWEGQLFVGDGDGVGQVYDPNYKRVATVTAGNGYSFDLHEFTLTPQNTAVVLSYERFKRDLRPWGGPRTRASWTTSSRRSTCAPAPCCSSGTAFGNVSPKESNMPPPTGAGFEWEYFHVNSAEITPDGNFLISARNTSTVYKIDRRTGKIIWKLGGKESTFKLGKGVRFDWQHSARAQPDGTINIYDNSAAPPTRKNSRVLNDPPGRAGQDGHAGEGVQAPARAALGQPGQRRDAAERQPVRRLGLAALVHRVRRAGQGRVRRPARPRQRQLPRVPLPVGRHAVARRRRSSRPPAAARSRPA